MGVKSTENGLFLASVTTPLPVLGFTDDAAVLATAIRLVATRITPEDRDAARAALKRGFDREG